MRCRLILSLILPVLTGVCRADPGKLAYETLSRGENGRARELAEAASQEGSAFGHYVLGCIYELGLSVEIDKARAEGFFKKSLKLALPAVKAGDADAEFIVGRQYLEGYGVEKDVDAGIRWIRSAAMKGHAYSQYNLGREYTLGRSLKKDPAEAIRWIRKSAEQGNATAQYGMGQAYKDGIGVRKDENESLVWFQKARQSGSLGGILMAHRATAERGDDSAQMLMGMMLLTGQDMPIDEAEGARWFRRAADQGNPEAQMMLAWLYGTGRGVPQDNLEAERWLRRAAEQGHADARVQLKELEASRVHEKGRQGPTPATTESAPASAVTSAQAFRFDEARLQKMIEQAMARAGRNQSEQAAALESDVDNPGYKLAERPDDFALVIGIEKYSEIVEARFAERDAEAVESHLLALGFPRRNVVRLTGPKATLSTFDKYLGQWLPQRVTEKSRVFVYFSGHGAPDHETGSTYLLPWEGDPSYLKTTAYPVKRLYARLNALKAKEIVVALDSCFSGAGGRSVLPQGTKPLVTKVDLGNESLGRLSILTASAASEISGTIAAQGHGTFTYYLLKGLEGSARDTSGAVTVFSLYQYILPKVQDAARSENRDQTPQLLPAGLEERGRFKLR